VGGERLQGEGVVKVGVFLLVDDIHPTPEPSFSKTR
jgi:hypothetical protein